MPSERGANGSAATPFHAHENSRAHTLLNDHVATIYKPTVDRLLRLTSYGYVGWGILGLPEHLPSMLETMIHEPTLKTTTLSR
jgi:hypothetical protein